MMSTQFIELSSVRIELSSKILLHYVILNSNTHYLIGIIIVLTFHVKWDEMKLIKSPRNRKAY